MKSRNRELNVSLNSKVYNEDFEVNDQIASKGGYVSLDITQLIYISDGVSLEWVIIMHCMA